MADIARALRRHWLVVLVLAGLGGGGAAAATWTLLQPKPTARSLLLVAQNQPKVVFNTADNPGNAAAEFVNYQKTQMALIKSRPVLTAALRQPKVAALSVVAARPYPIDWLETTLSVDNAVGPEILRVSIKGDRPDELVVLVSAVVDSYLREIVNKEHNRRQARLQQLKDICGKYDENLRSKRRSLKELAEAAGSGDDKMLAISHQLALEQLSMAKKDLMQYRSELRRREVEAAVGGPAIAHTRPVQVQDPVLSLYAQRVAQLDEKVLKIKEASARGDDEPALVPVQADLAAAKKAVEGRRAALAAERAAGGGDEDKAAAAEREAHLRVLRELTKSLTEEVNRLAEETRTINKSSLDLVSLREEIMKEEGISSKVSSEMEALKVEMQAPPRITLLEEAEVVQDNGKKRLMGTAGAGLGIATVALIGVTLVEVRKRRITNPQDVEDKLGLRLVGSLPQVRRPAALGPAAPTGAADRVLTESVDAAGAVLRHAAGVGGPRVVMVTSALGGEGKTSLACQLAASLARSGHRTLLVDCDLRKPAAHRAFGLPPGPGFGEVLAGAATLDEVMRPGGIDGLAVVAAGVCAGDPTRALTQRAAAGAFAAVCPRFDFVVLDSSPVLPVVDSMLLAQQADAVLFSVMRDVSRVPTVQAAVRRVEQFDVRILGAVVSGTRPGEQYTYEPAV